MPVALVQILGHQTFHGIKAIIYKVLIVKTLLPWELWALTALALGLETVQAHNHVLTIA